MTREVLRTVAATLSSFRVEHNMQGCYCRRARCAVCWRLFSWVDFSARGGIWTPSSAGRGCTPKGGRSRRQRLDCAALGSAARTASTCGSPEDPSNSMPKGGRAWLWRNPARNRCETFWSGTARQAWPVAWAASGPPQGRARRRTISVVSGTSGSVVAGSSATGLSTRTLAPLTSPFARAPSRAPASAGRVKTQAL